MKKALFVWGLLLPLGLLHAQTDPPPLVATGQYSNDFYQWTFSVGDLAIWTFHTPSQYWSQGSQQPVILMVDTHEADAQGLTATIYPNPTADVLYCRLQSENQPIGRIGVEILDAAGKLVRKAADPDGSPDQFSIPVGDLPSGRYLLRISDHAGRQLSKTFIKQLK